MTALGTAPTTVSELVQEAQRALDEGAPPAAVYGNAQTALRAWHEQGRVDVASVIEALETLEAEGMSVAAGNTLTGICLLAARLTDDRNLARGVAATHAAHALQLITNVPGIGPEQVIALADDAIRVIEEFDIESADPQLTADLILYRANVRLRTPGPQLVPGLDGARRGLRILRKIGSPGADPLAAQLAEQAQKAMDWALFRNAVPGEEGDVTEIIKAAIATFDAVGATEHAQTGRLRLMSILLEDHRLDEAATIGAALRKRAHPDDVDVTAQLADLASQQHEPTEALAMLDGVTTSIDDDPGLHQYVAAIRINSLRQLDRHPEAVEKADAIIGELERHEAPPDEVTHWARMLSHKRLLRAQIAADMGDLDDASRRFDAIASTFADQLPTDDMIIDLPMIAAESLWNDGETAHAEKWLDRAAQARADIADRLGDPTAIARHREARPDLDQRRSRLRIHRHDFRSALELAELGKSAVLADLSRYTGLDRSMLSIEAHSGLVHEIELAATELADTGRRLDALEPGDAERKEVATRYREVQDRERQLIIQLENRLTARFGTVRPPLTLDHQLDAILAADAALISLTLGRDGLGVVGIGPAGETGFAPGHPTLAELGAAVLDPLVAARERLTNEGAVLAWEAALATALADLDDALGSVVRDAAEMIGGSHLVLVPHRHLHGLPLPWIGSGSTLTDTLGPISILPALALHQPDAPSRRGDGTMVTVGLSDDRAPLLDLEAQALAAMYPSASAITAEAASPFDVAAALAAASSAHIAVHGIYTPGSVAQSGLQLTPPRPAVNLFGTGAGMVSTPAMLALFELDSLDHLVLSACETGLRDPSPTDERAGLPSLALAMGAAWVVASSWAVDDFSTLSLMLELHRRLPTETPASALANAARTIRTTPRHELVEEMATLDPLAESLGLRPALDRARQVFLARNEPVGADCWASFTAFGAPRTPLAHAHEQPQEEPWLAAE